MVGPKVIACYQKSQTNDITFYCAVDVSDYCNDVKAFERKLEVFRTDTNELIVSRLLSKEEFKASTPVQEGGNPSSPYINDLPIKAVLSVNGSIVSEDEISFVELKTVDINNSNISISKSSGSYLATDNFSYPIYDDKGAIDFERYFVNSRRSTSLPVSHKIQYIKKIDDDEMGVDFSWFNENVVQITAVFIDKETRQLIESSSSGYTITDQRLALLYSPGGIYIGSPNKDPIGDEDAAPNYGYLDEQNVAGPNNGIGLDFRPHLMIWRTLDGEAGVSSEGYPVPGSVGEERITPCRFHLGGSKVFKNEDSIETSQLGTIRIDVGECPVVGQSIEVVGHFKGVVREVYKGQMSHRLEV